jgi:negative regulator of sigma-B (phosphoserine phosphatase)
MAECGGADTVLWGVADRCRPGEQTSGDRAVVEVDDDGTLVAGIDGLGHGTEAAHAARLAAEAFRHAGGQSLVTLARRCHRALHGTRGVALSLVRVSTDGVMSWLGVGNVQGRVIGCEPAARGPKSSLAVAPGIAGHTLPRLHTETVHLAPGDVVILATDGVRPEFADRLEVSGSVGAISERVIEASWARDDDALVISVRYLGPRR